MTTNRTILELKLKWLIYVLLQQLSTNRTILELKFEFCHQFALGIVATNRTILELKLNCSSSHMTCLVGLPIAPYWN